MKMTLLITLLAIPVFYLILASILALLPVKKNPPVASLDFSVLNGVSDNITANEHTYTSRSGGELFYRQISGNKDTILVLLHGSGSEGRYLLQPAKKLSVATEINIVIPDLRGHGRSALGTLGDIEYLGQYEDDLEDLNHYLRNKYPNSSIILGGHSSGGGLALKYGGGENKEFDGYLFLSPYLGYKAPTVRPNSGGWIQVSTRRYAGLAMLNNVGIKIFNSLPVLFFNRPKEWNDPLQAESYSYRLNESFSPKSYEENLQKNKKPILVLVGRDDEAFYAEKFEAVFRKNAPQAVVKIIAGAKHLNLPNNETTISIIGSWINNTYQGHLQRPVDKTSPGA